MIPLNSRQALPSKAFGYLALRSMLAAVMLVLIGGLVQLLSALPSTCHGALCGVCLSGRQFAGILYLLGALILVGAVLNYKWFSFLLTDKTIRIDSGVMFRRSCTIRFDRIQDVDILRNPMHLLLGLKSVAIWTASFDQSHSRPHHLRSQQLVSTPPRGGKPQTSRSRAPYRSRPGSTTCCHAHI